MQVAGQNPFSLKFLCVDEWGQGRGTRGPVRNCCLHACMQLVFVRVGGRGSPWADHYNIDLSLERDICNYSLSIVQEFTV